MSAGYPKITTKLRIATHARLAEVKKALEARAQEEVTYSATVDELIDAWRLLETLGEKIGPRSVQEMIKDDTLAGDVSWTVHGRTGS